MTKPRNNPQDPMSIYCAEKIMKGDWDSTPYHVSPDNYALAGQVLIDVGMAWTLPGRIARDCAELIGKGYCKFTSPLGGPLV